MEAEFELTAADVAAFHAYHRRRQERRHLGRSLLIGAGLGLFVAVGLVFDAVAQANPLLLPAWLPRLTWDRVFSFFLGGLLAMWWMVWLVNRQLAQLNSGGLIRQRIVLDAEGVRDSSSRTERLTRWTGIRQVGRSADHVYLYLSPISALIVPRRAFADDDAFRRFHQVARQYHADALTAPFADHDHPSEGTFHACDSHIEDRPSR